MRKINKHDIDYIAMGSTVLGTGGGGDPYIGKLLAKKAIDKHGDVSLVSAEELDNDSFVVPIAAFGAPVILTEKLFSGDEFLKAFEMMEASIGRKVDAVMPIEAGGLNGVIPFSIAAQKKIPLVDADGMGRAFPRLEMVTFTLHGIPSSPITQADEKGNRITYQPIDNLWGETLVGTTAIQMGGSCAISCYPMKGKQIKETAIHGIITYAEQLGKAIIDAKKEKKDPVESLMASSSSIKLFSGKINMITIKVDGRWNKGLCEISGMGKNEGTTMILDFQNEFLIAKKNGTPVAMTPDLIVLIDAENGHPITAEAIQYGTRVVVLGMKADEQWRTEKGIELAGHKKFGYENEYIKIEKLNEI